MLKNSVGVVALPLLLTALALAPQALAAGFSCGTPDRELEIDVSQNNWGQPVMVLADPSEGARRHEIARLRDVGVIRLESGRRFRARLASGSVTEEVPNPYLGAIPLRSIQQVDIWIDVSPLHEPLPGTLVKGTLRIYPTDHGPVSQSLSCTPYNR